MEQFQRNTVKMEGQNSIEQFDMALLAHAMYILKLNEYLWMYNNNIS